jgi:hypothetical protein
MLHIKHFPEFGKVWVLGFSAQRRYSNHWWANARLVGFADNSCCSHLFWLQLGGLVQKVENILTAINASSNERIWELPTFQMLAIKFVFQVW